MNQDSMLSKEQENVKPGKISRHGFPGQDERSLAHILEDDSPVLNRLGCILFGFFLNAWIFSGESDTVPYGTFRVC